MGDLRTAGRTAGRPSRRQPRALCCQLLLLLCTLSHPLLRQWAAPPQEWEATPAAYCSGREGSVRLDDAGGRGFGVSRADCRASCAKDSECRMFSFGTWEKGLPSRLGGHRGDMRCQLYAQCVRRPQKGTAVFTKPATAVMGRLSRSFDLPAVIQMAANVLALVNGQLACVSVAVTAFHLLLTAYAPPGAAGIPLAAFAAFLACNLLVLLSLEWDRRKEEEEEPQSAGDSCRASVPVNTEDRVPSWRREDCQAPGWLMLLIVFCTAAGLPGLCSIASIAHRNAEARRPSSMFDRALRLLKREAPSVIQDTPPPALVVGTLAMTIAWACAILIIVLLPNLRDHAIPAGVALGSLALAFQLWLALAHACGGAAFVSGIAAHCAALIMLCACWAVMRSRAKDVVTAESKRDKRERELVALLVDRVQSRCMDLVDSSRWIAMVDICISCVVFGTFALVTAKAGQDIIFDTALMKVMKQILGINVPSALWYTLVALMVVMLAPLLVHFFLRIRDGMQRLSFSSSQGRARAMQRLAVETAECVAAREREALSHAIVDGTDSLVLSNLGKRHNGQGTPEDSMCELPRMKFSEFGAWVETQAKQLLEYRLGAAWHVHESFLLEGEAQNTFLAGSLHSAVSETTQNVWGAQRRANKSCLATLARWSWWPFVGAAVLCVAITVVAWQARANVSQPSPSSSTAASGASSSCGGGALKWGGALAAGATVLFAVPGVGPAGLAAIELASAAGIGAGGGVTQLISCYMR